MPRAIAIRKIDGKPGQVYYPLDVITQPDKPPGKNEVTVRISAAALNHRDLFLRQNLYPGTTFGVPLLADGTGVVVATGPGAETWNGQRVLLNPGSGWESDPLGPEKGRYAILGGTKANPIGTLADTVTISATELEKAPSHLSSVQAAALPLTGLTAWRAVMTKAQVSRGQNVLVTGIGGGVALMALLFAAAAGANVYVTSGSAEKIEKAKKLGAKGGVSYKNKGWEKELLALLPDKSKRFDAIIDGAGGDVVDKGMRILKDGGRIVVYGMTTSPKMPYIMGAVLRNIDVLGSTMGSRAEFAAMVKFVADKGLVPVVSRSVKSGLDDLDAIDKLFEDMKSGSQFGKLVVQLVDEDKSKSRL